MVSDELKEAPKKPRILLKIVIGIVILIGIFFLYAFKIEPKLLKVTEYALVNEKLPESFNGLKIVQFSDIHFGVSTGEKEMNQVIDKINYLKPDILVFTGDLFDDSINLTTSDMEYLTSALSKLNANIVKLAVKGDEDYLDENCFTDIFTKANFKILESENMPIYYESDTPIYISGISSITKNKYDLTNAFKKENTNNLQIFLVHEPVIFDDVQNETDFVLSGHSLGGLIRLPFINGVYKESNTGNYQKGIYKQKNSTLIVNGGIGAQKISARFNNIPEINLYRLYNN